MAEAIHCPSCTTRYRLRPERLKPVIRRAKCFTCGSIFSVGDVVQRLLAPAAEAVLPDPAPSPVEELDAIQPDESATETAGAPPLTLSDLDSTDPGLLEKTIVAAPEASLPEAKAEAEAADSYPPEITDTTLSGYTSARDAIDKLFGNAPRAGLAMGINPNPSAVDLDAALSAFEDTLGASLATVPPVGKGSLNIRSIASALSENHPGGVSNSTMTISQADILAAITAAPALSPTVSAPPPAEPVAQPQTSNPMAAEERFPTISPPTPPPSSAPVPDSPDPAEEMLRLKIGEDIYSGLTMPQLINWVEEGRILENHLVARQHSENWLDAHKVPGLRPVFERLRRERSSGVPSQDSGPGDPSPKKSLFGGLFGKG